jgi:membrane associated rhomboid family serine protease
VIPIRDINPTRRAPVVTYALIVINLVVFLHETRLGPHALKLFVDQYSVIPQILFSGYGPALATLVTSMFLHGSWGHLLGNMWFLHVFGDNVEDTLGHGRYVIFYLATGIMGVLAHGLTDPASHINMLGASGAISGVLGGYIMLHPRARVITWAIFIIEMPAWFFLLVWFGMQVWSGFGTLGDGKAGVAFFAHIGGFLAGVLLVLAWGRDKRPVTYLGPRVSSRELRRRSDY